MFAYGDQVHKFYPTAGKVDWVCFDQCCIFLITPPGILSGLWAGTTQTISRNTHWHVVVFVFAQRILVHSTVLGKQRSSCLARAGISLA